MRPQLGRLKGTVQQAVIRKLMEFGVEAMRADPDVLGFLVGGKFGCSTAALAEYLMPWWTTGHFIVRSVCGGRERAGKGKCDITFGAGITLFDEEVFVAGQLHRNAVVVAFGWPEQSSSKRQRTSSAHRGAPQHTATPLPNVAHAVSLSPERDEEPDDEQGGDSEGDENDPEKNAKSWNEGRVLYRLLHQLAGLPDVGIFAVQRNAQMFHLAPDHRRMIADHAREALLLL